MPRREKTLTEQYKPYLLTFMTFWDGVQYEKEHDFSNEILGNVTPQEIVRWMSLKVYGTPDPTPDEDGS